MSKFIDAFGEAYMAYLNGEPSNHYVERDDGNISESDSAYYYFRTYDEWKLYEQQAIQEAKGRVLDIGLGAGRHALYLQEKGLKVVGIDTSPLAIQVSQRRGVKNARVMSLFDCARAVNVAWKDNLQWKILQYNRDTKVSKP